MNKVQINLSFVAILLLFATIVHAQDTPVSFGVKTGLNLSNANSDNYDTDLKIGYNVGFTMNIALPVNGLSIMSGLEFTTKGLKDISQTQQGITIKILTTADAMYLQVPVHLGFKADISRDAKIIVRGGPYFAYGIGGKTKQEGLSIKSDGRTVTLDYNSMLDWFESEGQDISGIKKEIDTFDSDQGLKRFDIGIGAGIGIEFSSVSATIGYDLGLVNISRDSDPYKNQNIYLSLGYRF